MPHTSRRISAASLIPAGTLLAALLLAGCGGASVASTAGSAQSSNNSSPGSGGTSTGGQGATPGAGTSQYNGPQYLVKSLQVNMQVYHTQQVADDLLAWVANTDPRSSTAGQDYEQTSDNLYSITLKFSVQASLYPQVEHYLAGYAAQHGGKLLSLHETVQDVTNDYIDTQSRLTNLRGEQQRLLDLLAHATNLSDTLSIEQRLTDVEGQIEQIEAHQNALQAQTTFYTVEVDLQPAEAPAPAPIQAGAFQPGQTLHDALSAALVFAEWLASVLIWLAVFSVFALPVLAVILLVRRWRRRGARPQPATVAP
jgi:hypothetical protein